MALSGSLKLGCSAFSAVVGGCTGITLCLADFSTVSLIFTEMEKFVALVGTIKPRCFIGSSGRPISQDELHSV